MSPLPGRPSPLVLAAPSGTGKTTIARRLVEGDGPFTFSVSATTRPPRSGERDGDAYQFVDEDEFRSMVDAGDLVEWATVHGHLYGTPLKNLEDAVERDEHVVLDIDVQGARQIRERVPDAILVFVFPPSAEALVTRLAGRGTEAAEDVALRLKEADVELEQARNFDYIVVNDELERAVEEVRAIVRAESHRPLRARDFDGNVMRLREEIQEALKERTARAGE